MNDRDYSVILFLCSLLMLDTLIISLAEGLEPLVDRLLKIFHGEEHIAQLGNIQGEVKAIKGGVHATEN